MPSDAKKLREKAKKDASKKRGNARSTKPNEVTENHLDADGNSSQEEADVVQNGTTPVALAPSTFCLFIFI
jgi:hypothetical protein